MKRTDHQVVLLLMAKVLCKQKIVKEATLTLGKLEYTIQICSVPGFFHPLPAQMRRVHI